MSVRDETRKSLPSGTVTMLFADVEGSTRLLHALGTRYAPARARMREIVRAVATERHGHEVDWAGDGVFLAFSRAREAVVAAAELQQALAGEPWAPEGVLRLRMGIHTGEPELGDEGYVGIDVVIAARICAAGHGDQIVVSRATQHVSGDEPFPGGSFRPLGRHRLKDVPSAEQLFQLAGPGLPDAFPPLRTLGGATLPALHHRLVGRGSDLTAIRRLLARPDVRLVTITGPGGAGKSRLALEVAGVEAIENPVHLVGLAPISDPELVPAAIARTLGVRETPGRPLIATLGDALAGTGALLLLDNLEHLPTAATQLAQLLDLAPDVKALTTSRVPLRLSGEHVFPLDPLPVDEASELFTELAAARGVLLHEDTLDSIREICRRLDCLPLAIELVAARLVILPPAQILKALDEGLALEMEGPIDLPERQRTLRATIDWSYGLLSDRQRELHGVLAVFAGGCTMTDARAIAGRSAQLLADLESLVAWSLLRSDVADGDVRLSMLETVREHAVARLEVEGGLEDLRRRHAERFLGLAATAEAELAGPDQASWLERLEAELDNIRAAFDWCLSSGRVEDALRAMSALGRFWRAHGHASEARRWLSLGLGLANDVAPDVRADALWTAARQAMAQSATGEAKVLVEEALPLFRASGRGRDVVFALSELAYLTLEHDAGRAHALSEEALALARELDDPRAISGSLNILATIVSAGGDRERAVAMHGEALTLRRALGDRLLIVDSAYNLGEAAFFQGDAARAQSALEEALALADELGERLHTAAATCLLGELALREGDLPRAGELLRESLAMYVELADDRTCAECMCALGGVAAAEGASEHAARLWGAADTLRGDAPLWEHEREIVARFGPSLAAALASARIDELRAEGAKLGVDLVGGEVLSGTTHGE
ncbi:MAG: tetratricopeptide repeat protein [Gaiellaceae bacterium]